MSFMEMGKFVLLIITFEFVVIPARTIRPVIVLK